MVLDERQKVPAHRAVSAGEGLEFLRPSRQAPDVFSELQEECKNILIYRLPSFLHRDVHHLRDFVQIGGRQLEDSRQAKSGPARYVSGRDDLGDQRRDFGASQSDGMSGSGHLLQLLDYLGSVGGGHVGQFHDRRTEILHLVPRKLESGQDLPHGRQAFHGFDAGRLPEFQGSLDDSHDVFRSFDAELRRFGSQVNHLFARGWEFGGQIGQHVHELSDLFRAQTGFLVQFDRAPFEIGVSIDGFLRSGRDRGPCGRDTHTEQPRSSLNFIVERFPVRSHAGHGAGECAPRGRQRRSERARLKIESDVRFG